MDEGTTPSASEALRALQLHEARWQALLDTARDAIIGIEPTGRITLFNRGAEAMFGYAATDVMGRNVSMLMPSPYREQHDTYLASYRATGVAKAIGLVREVQGRRHSGDVFPIELSVSEARVGDDVIFSAIIRDVTDRKRADERERQLVKLASQNERLADIGAVTARIAHDFGNPLAGLQMTAERILRRVARDPAAPVETVKQAAETLLATAKRLDALLADFKEFARDQQLQLVDIELPVFLQDVAASWEAEAIARGIVTQSAIDTPDPLSVRADRTKLQRILDNLVKNALEAIDHGPGFVRLAALRVDEDHVRIDVEDSGPGLPPGVDVFAMFETTKPNGTGLGLPICQEIARAHGGGIAVAPRLPNGTVFRVELPLHGLRPHTR